MKVWHLLLAGATLGAVGYILYTQQPKAMQAQGSQQGTTFVEKQVSGNLSVVASTNGVPYLYKDATNGKFVPAWVVLGYPSYNDWANAKKVTSIPEQLNINGIIITRDDIINGREIPIVQQTQVEVNPPQTQASTTPSSTNIVGGMQVITYGMSTQAVAEKSAGSEVSGYLSTTYSGNITQPAYTINNVVITYNTDKGEVVPAWIVEKYGSYETWRDAKNCYYLEQVSENASIGISGYTAKAIKQGLVYRPWYA